MNHVTLKGTLPRAPRIMEPSSEDKKPIALFSVACRNGDLGGLNFIEVKAFGEEAIVANDRLTEKTEVEIKGYIRSESWTPKGKNQAKQYRQVVVADYIGVLNRGLVVEDARDHRPAEEAVA
jgi:single-stranded DNA-binding protein